jgi:hypothetical protein
MAERPQTTKVVLIATLGIILAVVLLIQFGGLPGGSKKDGGAAAVGQGGQTDGSAAPNAPSTGPAVEMQWKRPDPIGPILRDPTQIDLSQATRPEPNEGPETPAPTQFEYAVRGIIYSTEQPSSIIIDGRILHEGDTIHGATVVKITKGHAELSRGDKTWTIKPGASNKEPE